ncbi:hypothetical protein GOV14_01620 [Candidatus Pacearchaeota archaeon]|nr:hypothetical protein [Candidatus Pacearchaeota archaeon]
MPEFKKSRRYADNHEVVHNGEAIKFHDKETGQLYRNLKEACSKDTGYGQRFFFDDKSCVDAYDGGIILKSEKRNGTWERLEMSYRDARRLLVSIEEQVSVEEKLKRM